MENIEAKRAASGMIKDAITKSKPVKCILCGREQTSFCNSHSIPLSYLKNIANEGMVYSPIEAMGLENITTLNIESGVKKTGTFQFICRECDGLFFRDYEDNESNLCEALSDKVMAEIAVKNILQMLFKRNAELELDKSMAAHPNNKYDYSVADFVKDLDREEYLSDLEIYKTIIDNNESAKFKVAIHEVLPYRIPIASQAVITVKEDMEGREINNVFAPANIRMQNLHICAFPLEDKSVILAFYHVRNRNYRSLLHQLNTISRAERLAYLNYLIFKYTENYFYSESVREVIKTSDKLKSLCREELYGALNIRSNTSIKWNEIPNLLSEEYAIRK